MRTVLLFGTFDFLHAGHLHAFREAKQLGDRLVVCVARDAAVLAIKGKAPIHNETERLDIVRHIDVIADAFLGDIEQGVYSCFSEVQPDIIAIGYDQRALHESITQYMAAHHIDAEIRILAPYKNGVTTSSTIKQALTL